MNETVKKADAGLKNFGKELNDMSKINPLKGEISEINETLKQTEQTMKGFDKELKDISKIDPLK